MPSSSEGGLGLALVGEKIVVNHRQIQVSKMLGEGGFSYVYLVKEISDTASGQSMNNTVHGGEGERGVQRSSSGRSVGKDTAKRQGSMGRGSDGGSSHDKKDMVLKVTSIFSRQQRDIAEKEAKLLSRLTHPSIIKMYDACYRTVPVQSSSSSGFRGNKEDANKKERPQHVILMEFCEGGHALDVCSNMIANGTRFDLSSLIIAFGQICNAVSYLHAQRPPIVHRDLKPANFLVKSGAYKLCDFGSAVFGHVDLKTPENRAEAEEVIQKTTTQMFRAPEMVDLYSAKKLTQATDVWALGCCLYSMAFLQNCFEEGSNLAILSRKYKIPDDNPYGDGLVELIDRMLTVDIKARCDMTEVILCLSAVYSGRPLPPRKTKKESKKERASESAPKEEKRSPRPKKSDRAGTFRTDGQGMVAEGLDPTIGDPKKPKEGKTLNPNSVAARRKKSACSNMEFSSFHSKFEEVAAEASKEQVNQDMAFSAGADHFAAFGDSKGSEAVDANIFGSFVDDANGASNDVEWDGTDDPFNFADNATSRRTKSAAGRRPRRRADSKGDENLAIEAAVEAFSGSGESDDGTDEDGVSRSVRRPSSGRRGLRRTNSSGAGIKRSKSKGRTRRPSCA